MIPFTHRAGFTAAFIAAAGAFACGGADRTPGSTGSADTATATVAGASGDSLTLPDGFRATVFADSLGQARQIAIRPNGDVYLNTRRSPSDTSRPVPAGGFLVALRDTNQDGRADLIQRFGGEGGDGGTGIALFKDALYVEAGGSILRFRLRAEELVPDAKPETVVSDLPSEKGHTAHPIAIGIDGNLFVNVGSATNSCQEKDRQVGSAGERPCRELATRAGIWRFRA
ncbi:MAG: DUF7133 domain-containing protein, partial [Gemmatimonadales bacterium]